ncbi:MAG: cystathionine gamma-synthase [Chloroflexales bacterium]|nr:cystathionine gamma-synthase [Chloroflexales bacterium]
MAPEEVHEQHDGFATQAIHVGQAPDPQTGAVSVPIYQTSTYAQPVEGGAGPYVYARSSNPTRAALEAALAALDGGAHALAFASGLGAASTVLLALATGDHVVCSDDVYGGIYRLLTKVFVRQGLQVDFVDVGDPDQVAAAIRPETKLVWLESPTNPLLKLADIAAISRLARARGVRTLVDNTFASPFFQRPLALGADLVLYSTTKYLGGHSDAVGGALVTSDPELYAQLKFLQNAVGAVPGPFDSWLILRGVKTLAHRMRAHEANAQAIARFLLEHPAVAEVFYPGLEQHPQHALSRRQMRGFGGIVSFRLRGGAAAARALVGRTRLFTFAVSLGGVESLIEIPATMTHASTADTPLAVPPDLVRLSVGIEDQDDLLADLQQALDGA